MTCRSEMMQDELRKRVDAIIYLDSIPVNRYHSLEFVPDQIFYQVADLIDSRSDIILHEIEPKYFKKNG